MLAFYTVVHIRKWLIITSIVAFSCFSVSAESIRVVTENLPPYQIINKDGSIGGFATEVVIALFEITKDHPQVEVMPWARAYEQALHEENTLIYSIYRTQYREAFFQWIGPLMSEHVYFWGLNDSFPDPVKSLADLHSYTVAASRNSNAEQYLQAGGFIHIYPTVDDEQPMRMLLKNRIDLIIDTELIMNTRAKNLNLDISNIKAVIEIPQLQANLSMAFSNGTSPEIISRFQAAYQKLKVSGQLASIRQRWGIPQN